MDTAWAEQEWNSCSFSWSFEPHDANSWIWYFFVVKQNWVCSWAVCSSYQGRDLHKKATCCSVPLKALSWWDRSCGLGGPRVVPSQFCSVLTSDSNPEMRLLFLLSCSAHSPLNIYEIKLFFCKILEARLSREILTFKKNANTVKGLVHQSRWCQMRELWVILIWCYSQQLIPGWGHGWNVLMPGEKLF